MKKVLMKIATILAATAIASSIALPAQANSSDGGASGSGGGSTRETVWRVSVGEDGTNQAFNEFRRHANQGGDFDKFMRETGVNRQLCENSRVIWWLQGDNGREKYWNHRLPSSSNTIYANRANYLPDVSFENARPTGSRGATDYERRMYFEWKKNNDPNRTNITIVCSKAFIKEVPPQEIEKDEKATDQQNNRTVKITGVYSRSTSVNPVKIEGQYPGGGDYHAQSSPSHLTDFGKRLEEIRKAGGVTDFDAVKKELQRLADESYVTSYSGSEVNLSDRNRSAFAKGGILNVTEHSKLATFEMTERTNVKRVKKCIWRRTFDTVNGEWGYWYMIKCDPPRESTSSKSIVASHLPQTSFVSGFWQMISAHCNKKDFDQLVAETGASYISKSDNDKGVAYAAKTKLYKEIPSVLDFGYASNPNPAAAKTATMGFYDKECDFLCTSERADYESNDAVYNVGEQNNVPTNGLYGAISLNDDAHDDKLGLFPYERINSNNFEFFRDNVNKAIRLDSWYPASSPYVHYDGSPAVTTTITRWDQGTPSVTGEDGGKFVMKTKNNQTLFTGNDQVKTQKNWDKSTFSNSNATIINGFANEFLVRSSWSSEKDRPQIFNVRWEYEPTVITRMPYTVGFNRNGENITMKASGDYEAESKVQGKCFAEFGTKWSKNRVEEMYQNTGSGTQNNIDGKIFGGNTDYNASTNLVINFVRATAE